MNFQCVGKVGEVKSVARNGVVELSMLGKSDGGTVQFNQVLLTTDTAPPDEVEEESEGIDTDVFLSLLQSGLLKALRLSLWKGFFLMQLRRTNIAAKFPTFYVW